MFAPLLAVPLFINILFPAAGNRIATSTPTRPIEARTQVRTIEERKATVEARISLLRRERIRAYWGRMITRIEAAIERLELLIARMERRIAIIKETDSSLDTAGAETAITGAKSLLSQAEADLQDAKDAFEEMLESEEPKAAFGQVIESVRKIKTSLVEVHRLLVKAIGSIKGLRVGTETPTP